MPCVLFLSVALLGHRRLLGCVVSWLVSRGVCKEDGSIGILLLSYNSLLMLFTLDCPLYFSPLTVLIHPVLLPFSLILLTDPSR